MSFSIRACKSSSHCRSHSHCYDTDNGNNNNNEHNRCEVYTKCVGQKRSGRRPNAVEKNCQTNGEKRASSRTVCMCLNVVRGRAAAI